MNVYINLFYFLFNSFGCYFKIIILLESNMSLPVSQFEIARFVAKSLEDMDPGMKNKSSNSANVLKVLGTIAKFVSHFFRNLG